MCLVSGALFVFPRISAAPRPSDPRRARGLDKLVHDDKGVTTISNDGATIMKVRDHARDRHPERSRADADDATNRADRPTDPRSRPVFQPRKRAREPRAPRKNLERARFVSAARARDCP